MITDEQRKILTEELLKECWHEFGIIHVGYLDCLNCGMERKHVKENRTFDNWNDFGAVVEKLGTRQAYVFIGELANIGAKEIPERFCILVAEAKKKGEIE